jgi:hypothetical protein
MVVHTTGVNWQSIGVIAAIIGVAVTVILAMLARRDRRMEQQNTEIKDEISNAVNHLSEVLLARLETKETVSKISERLARLEGATNTKGVE